MVVFCTFLCINVVWYQPNLTHILQGNFIGTGAIIWLLQCQWSKLDHDEVIKWNYFLRYWPFVWGIHRSPVNSPHKGQWHGALMFSLICIWINGWVNNCEAGDWRCYRAHYDESTGDMEYHKTSNLSCTLVDNKFVDHSRCIWSIICLSVLFQLHLYSWLDTWLQWIEQRQLQNERKHLSLGIWCDLY